MSLCVLGSGSGGNCSALALSRKGRRRPDVTLIDCGLSIKQTAKRMEAVGLKLGDVKQVLVTHFDSDHFKQVWIRRAEQRDWRIRFHINHWHLANRAGAPEVEHEPFDDDGPFELEDGCVVYPIRLDHDTNGTVGYRVEAGGRRLGFATDLGRVPDRLLDEFANIDLLALESNYCPQMQMDSPRPVYLKRRIMGGRGHLSNQESLEAVKLIADQSERLERIVLLHLSRQCNSPGKILSLYAQFPELSRKLVLSNQDRPTEWVHLKCEGNGTGRAGGRPVATGRKAAPVIEAERAQLGLWEG
ncbi:MAG: MBL fold metallo-hydrolase [Planctomycetes bacterium]|nr:MBL fold metallo-hydrolase [Planctomycetota bacterium]